MVDGRAGYSHCRRRGCDVQTCGLELGQGLGMSKLCANKKTTRQPATETKSLKRAFVCIRDGFPPISPSSNSSSRSLHRTSSSMPRWRPISQDGKLRLPRSRRRNARARGQAPEVSPAYSGAARRTPPPKMTMACSALARGQAAECCRANRATCWTLQAGIAQSASTPSQARKRPNFG